MQKKEAASIVWGEGVHGKACRLIAYVLYDKVILMVQQLTDISTKMLLFFAIPHHNCNTVYVGSRIFLSMSTCPLCSLSLSPPPVLVDNGS